MTKGCFMIFLVISKTIANIQATNIFLNNTMKSRFKNKIDDHKKKIKQKRNNKKLPNKEKF